MKITLSRKQAADRLTAFHPDNWTHEGAYVMAGWIEEMDRGAGMETEFNATVIDCEFTEYPSAMEYMEDVNAGAMADWDIGDEDIAREWMRGRVPFKAFEGGIIVQNY